jgi:hypothetical protein
MGLFGSSARGAGSGTDLSLSLPRFLGLQLGFDLGVRDGYKPSQKTLESVKFPRLLEGLQISMFYGSFAATLPG